MNLQNMPNLYRTRSFHRMCDNKMLYMKPRMHQRRGENQQQTTLFFGICFIRSWGMSKICLFSIAFLRFHMNATDSILVYSIEVQLSFWYVMWSLEHWSKYPLFRLLLERWMRKGSIQRRVRVIEKVNSCIYCRVSAASLLSLSGRR